MIAQHTTTAEACDYLTEKLSLQELKELISRTKNERFYLPGIDKSRVNKDKSRQQALDFSDLVMMFHFSHARALPQNILWLIDYWMNN